MQRSVGDLTRGESAILGVPTLEPMQRMRLAELGLRAGEKVTLSQRGVGGARIVDVAGSRIALDRHTASLLPVVGICHDGQLPTSEDQR